MLKRTQVDIPLLITGILLVATVAAFFAGLFPYPFGFVILCFAMLGRILQLGGIK